ncbi:hypothetical protein A2765_02550 [Candidatus Kaiserbacteria bacterium RIFCSPHIGHO2_01_FULL_56_24]|uniref:Polyprenyl synthetase n=1 Tax=Candidatus Kaiserbacteria bacterium RIFCSPHIGHO2_01_FULL_56_24 TaxID=1798487 RepID=A0A1F6DAY9_9BACT|nr:MAG: hypothetical protein A2765_02550 [Candidatus Kaiserbacteria bacterium RIFCSPHIGHO2_01_FULL_56_24]
MIGSRHEKSLNALKHMSVRIDAELARALEERAHGPAAAMYHMLRYFLGFVDEDFKASTEGGGKRFRPALCLLIAQGYGAGEKALDAAVAIELFHNLTLIHDDVEDHDEYRRGKPTVWKLWGINNAINAGDIQSLIVARWVARAARQSGAEALSDILLETFIEVWEGQYLDFELADAPLDSGVVSEERYLLMTEKKSGALVRVAAEAAGVAAGKDEQECARLREYGVCLGIAYQIADDYRSVWATKSETGKDAHGDIREHKRTLPFLAAFAEAQGAAKDRLKGLYSLSRQLSEAEISEALALIDAADVRRDVQAKIREYSARAMKAVSLLSLDEETKALLAGIVEMLVPEGGDSGIPASGGSAAIALA